MYALVVDFIKPAEEVKKYAERHGAWVNKHFQEGSFLLAGPKKCGLGGVILTKSMDKKVLNVLLADDPYVTEDVAEYRIVDFDCKLTVDTLSALKGM